MTTSTAKNLKTGSKVKWNSAGGEATGKVVEKVTGKTHIKGHKVSATKDEPQYIVETDSGKKAAHKAEALKKA